MDCENSINVERKTKPRNKKAERQEDKFRKFLSVFELIYYTLFCDIYNTVELWSRKFKRDDKSNLGF
jgi:hypothetical protein